MTTTCENCGQSYGVGQWYQCPHGSVRGGVVDDELPGGARWIENLGPEPVWIETKTQLKQELDARGLEPFVRHVDGDQHVQRWVSVDLTDYDDPAIRKQRQAEMAAHCGLTLEQFQAIAGSRVTVSVSEPEQYPVIERYTRTAEAFRVRI